MINRLVSRHQTLRRAPRSPAHSPPSQFNPSHTFDRSYLLLNSKDMNIEYRIL